jgi:hypothetical protein
MEKAENAETNKLRLSLPVDVQEIPFPAAPRMTEDCSVMMFICDHCIRRRVLGKRVANNAGATVRLG